MIKSGEGEIRTLGPLQDAGFQDRCNRPLCHLSEETPGKPGGSLVSISRFETLLGGSSPHIFDGLPKSWLCSAFGPGFTLIKVLVTREGERFGQGFGGDSPGGDQWQGDVRLVRGAVIRSGSKFESRKAEIRARVSATLLREESRLNCTSD